MWTSASWRVPQDLKVVLIPRDLHTHSIISLTPLTPGQVEGGLALCFWEKRFGVFSDGAINHMSRISVGPEDSSHGAIWWGDKSSLL